MAEVFRAESQPVAGISRRVAIKWLLHASEQDPQLVHSLLDEARIWVRLQHPNVVSVLDFGEHDRTFFLALELIEGMSAAEILRHGGPLPVDEALCITERVARALDHAHAVSDDEGRPLGVVHRDVKPGNILVSERGDVKLTDFGIARATDRITRTQSGLVKGSLTSMAPEQARGEPLDGRADLFALGCVLHALLTGRTPIPGAGAAMLEALAKGPIPPPPEHLPANVRRLLDGMLAFRREDRVASAGEVAREIRTILLPSTPDDAERMLADRVVRLRIARGDDRPSRTSGAGVPPSASGADPARGPLLPGLPPGAPGPGAAPMPLEIPLTGSHPSGAPARRTGTESPTFLHRAFEILPRGITRRIRRARDAEGRPSLLLMGSFAVALTVLAILAVGPVMSWLGRANCSASRTALASVLDAEGAAAAAANVAAFALRCPADTEGGVLRARLLAMSGDGEAAEAALPPEAERDLPQRLAVAAIRFADGRYAEAEQRARQLFREDATGQARCLAAAAALNQDQPDRAETHLRDTFTDCGRILRAAALAQRGELRAARTLLRDPVRSGSSKVAYESARARLALFSNEMEPAAASALSATSAAGLDPLAPDPWIWLAVPSPRGGHATALRVTGPFDDPLLHTRLLEGDAARARGNLDLALKHYDAAIARRGRIAAAEVRAAAVLKQLGRPELARARLARALEADPRHAPALVALALLEERSDSCRAAAHAAAALRIEPENRDARRIADAGRKP